MSKAIENIVKFPHLLQSELLINLPYNVQSKFLSYCKVNIYPKATVFIEQGQVAKGIFLIAHGSVEVSRMNLAGQSTFMGQAVIGNCVGEIEALAEKECIASCMARKDTVLLFLPTHRLMEFLPHREFIKNLTLTFYERMNYNNSFRSIDKLDPVDVRLRAYLHFMSISHPKIDKSQADLAEVICCARQTMNKELGKLRKNGIVDLENGAVIVLDRDKLVEGIEHP